LGVSSKFLASINVLEIGAWALNVYCGMG
jgi:hypothetical protein